MPDRDNQNDDNDSSRIFRYEVMISDADLRVEVANQISRTISGDEVIDVQTKEVGAKGGTTIRRQGRNRTVGTYRKKAWASDNRLMTGSVKEEVMGGVSLFASLESESIIGGLYVGTTIGAHIRMSLMGDFLIWGGYLEADLTRVEIAGAQIRAYYGYAHTVAARININSRYIDDISVRVVNGVLVSKALSSVINLGTPGSGQNLES